MFYRNFFILPEHERERGRKKKKRKEEGIKKKGKKDRRKERRTEGQKERKKLIVYFSAKLQVPFTVIIIKHSVIPDLKPWGFL